MHTWRYARSSIRVFRGLREGYTVSYFRFHLRSSSAENVGVRNNVRTLTVTAPPLSADQSWDNEIIIIIVRYAH